MKVKKSILSVGPFFLGTILIIKIIAFLLQKKRIRPVLSWSSRYKFVCFVGFLLIAVGITLWIKANIPSRLIRHVKENKLVTDGVFAYVRHPIYSAFLHLFKGLILMLKNINLFAYLSDFILAVLTILMIQIEEKKLTQEFGKKYM